MVHRIGAAIKVGWVQQAAGYNLRNVKQGNLFVPHSTKAHHWRCKSRADDTIIFANGSKLCPIEIETFIATHDDVDGPIVIGKQRPFPILLIVPSRPIPLHERKSFVEALWPKIKLSITKATGNGQIQAREHILVADLEHKPDIA
ncbi:hypothetical protein BST61_g4702 [Cercospora zeina]